MHIPSDFHGTKKMQQVRAKTANLLLSEYAVEENQDWKEITKLSYMWLIEKRGKYGRKGAKI